MPRQIRRTMGIKDWLLLVLLSVLWGGSFFFVEIALLKLAPFTLVSLRVGIAALALWIYVIASDIAFSFEPRLWGTFIILGLINNALPFSFIVWGQTEISASLASILNATTPIFTVIVASLFLADERASPLQIAGILLGVAGVIVMIGFDALAGPGTALLAQFAVLMAAFCYGFGIVYGRHFNNLGLHPIFIATGQTTTAAFMLFPFAFFVETPDFTGLTHLPVLLSVLAVAVLSTALAYILFFKLLSGVGATNVSLVTLLVPVSAILLGMIVLGERLSFTQFIGMGLIALGLLVIDGRLFRPSNTK